MVAQRFSQKLGTYTAGTLREIVANGDTRTNKRIDKRTKRKLKKTRINVN